MALRVAVATTEVTVVATISLALERSCSVSTSSQVLMADSYLLRGLGSGKRAKSITLTFS